jgi:hypothetical protein
VEVGRAVRCGRLVLLLRGECSFEGVCLSLIIFLVKGSLDGVGELRSFGVCIYILSSF